MADDWIATGGAIEGACQTLRHRLIETSGGLDLTGQFGAPLWRFWEGNRRLHRLAVHSGSSFLRGGAFANSYKLRAMV